MKIKSVCELTGLSSRAVRFYIEENLIAPEYTENYMGRRTYDFSEKDVAELKDIAILRSFGFTVAEIRRMIECPDDIGEIISSIRKRKQETIEAEQRLLAALLLLDSDKQYTVAEIAAVLGSSDKQGGVPAQDSGRLTFRSVFYGLGYCIRAFAGLFPVLLIITRYISLMRRFHYFNTDLRQAIPLCMIALVPTFAVLAMERMKKKKTRGNGLRITATVLCVLYLPVSLICAALIPGWSETSDIRNYRDLDVECVANNSEFYQEMFPKWPHYFVDEKDENGDYYTRYLDSRYFYRYVADFDYTYDIIAEWPLEKEEFDAEISRVLTLFEENGDYISLKKGAYTCFVIYHGAGLFNEVTDNYDYDIFAYDPQKLRVRYISCSSLQNGSYQPYYLELDW